jgi:hypothetical protein
VKSEDSRSDHVVLETVRLKCRKSFAQEKDVVLLSVLSSRWISTACKATLNVIYGGKICAFSSIDVRIDAESFCARYLTSPISSGRPHLTSVEIFLSGGHTVQCLKGKSKERRCGLERRRVRNDGIVIGTQPWP